MNNISSVLISSMVIFVILYGVKKKVDVFEQFMIGVEDAIKVIRKIFPALVGLFVAVGLLRMCGILDLITEILKPAANFFGIPSEIVPLVLLRPISGSASLSFAVDIMNKYGADSSIGKIVSVMMGTTETIFYVFAVYFGSVGIKKLRYALLSALLAEIVGVLLICYIFK